MRSIYSRDSTETGSGLIADDSMCGGWPERVVFRGLNVGIAFEMPLLAIVRRAGIQRRERQGPAAASVAARSNAHASTRRGWHA